MRKMARLGAISMLAGATLFSGPASFASPPPDHGESALVRAGVGQAAPNGGVIVEGTTASVGDLKVNVPTAAKAPRKAGARFWFDGDHVQQVVQAVADGMQILSVIKSAAAPKTYNYDFVGRTLEVDTNGWVIVRAKPMGEPQAVIQPAWAKDNQGRPIATRYTVRGSVLTQTVEFTSGSAFPVVADPNIARKWYGWQVQFSRNETKAAAIGFGACWAVSAGIPDITVSKIVSISCGLVTVWAAGADSYGKCIAMNIWYTGGMVPWYWNC